MKDLVTILVCNAIRRAEHETKRKGGQLDDREVLAIALKTQLDYHQAEMHRFANQYDSAMD